MRVALNLLYLIPGVVGGTETYGRSLVRGLAAVDPENEYLLFVNREASDIEFTTAANFSRVLCNVRAKSRAARYAWEQTILPVQLARHRIDVAHSLGYVGPILAPCPHVASVHDLNYVGQGSAMTPARRAVLRLFVGATVRSADHIITISNFSRLELTRRFALDPDRVTVTYLAARLTDLDVRAASHDRGHDRYNIRPPYFVAFSSPFRHKNIPALIEAFATIAPEVPHTLVLIGHPAPDVRARVAAMGDLSRRVIHTGFVPAHHLVPLLRGADLMVFPSTYEGFGLPILDAHTIGLPVVSSNAAALPEVAGDAAIYFDPLSTSSMAGAIRRGLTDADLRQELADLGKRNAGRFSWEQTARLSCAIYNRLHEGVRRGGPVEQRVDARARPG
jgi:glycosyltransferase involved in cell wall biosynthesis